MIYCSNIRIIIEAKSVDNSDLKKISTTFPNYVVTMSIHSLLYFFLVYWTAATQFNLQILDEIVCNFFLQILFLLCCDELQ